MLAISDALPRFRQNAFASAAVKWPADCLLQPNGRCAFRHRIVAPSGNNGESTASSPAGQSTAVRRPLQITARRCIRVPMPVNLSIFDSAGVIMLTRDCCLPLRNNRTANVAKSNPAESHFISRVSAGDYAGYLLTTLFPRLGRSRTWSSSGKRYAVQSVGNFLWKDRRWSSGRRFSLCSHRRVIGGDGKFSVYTPLLQQYAMRKQFT